MLSTLVPPASILLVSFYVLYLLFSAVQRLRTRRRHGCLPARRVPQSWWHFGADVQAQMAAAKTSGHQTRVLQSLFERYNDTFQAVIWGQPWLWTCDAQNIKAINTTCFSSFGVEPLRKPANTGWMGNGIFVSDGEHWRASRSLFKPLFATTGTAHLDALQRHISNVFDVLPTNGETVDLQRVIRRMYLDVSFSYLLGASPGALQPDETSALDVDRFHTAFETATVGMSRRHALGRAFRWADHSERRWREACAYVHEIFDHYIDEAVRTHEAQSNGTAIKELQGDVIKDEQPTEEQQEPMSMLHSLVQFTHDRIFLRDQLLNVFLGAKDTATIGISDIFFNLARHPETWKKLRAEVTMSVDSKQPLTPSTLKALPYLQSVMKESLRLLSPVDMMNRVCVQDTVLPRGGGPTGDAPLFVRKGTRVEGRLAPMHRDKHFWGEDAEDFVPERWRQWEGNMEESNDEDGVDYSKSRMTDAHPPRWEYVPFLGGGRMCPARQMSLTQYALLLVRFAQQFKRIENRDPEPQFVEEIKFGKQSANGVLVGLIYDN